MRGGLTVGQISRTSFRDTLEDNLIEESNTALSWWCCLRPCIQHTLENKKILLGSISQLSADTST